MPKVLPITIVSFTPFDQDTYELTYELRFEKAKTTHTIYVRKEDVGKLRT